MKRLPASVEWQKGPRVRFTPGGGGLARFSSTSRPTISAVEMYEKEGRVHVTLRLSERLEIAPAESGAVRVAMGATACAFDLSSNEKPRSMRFFYTCPLSVLPLDVDSMVTGRGLQRTDIHRPIATPDSDEVNYKFATKAAAEMQPGVRRFIP